ncbi:MAG: FAD synthetase family protein [Chloroflexota bacterium]
MADARVARPEVVHGIDALERGHGRLFIVVGVFDGLHLGHAYLLRHLKAAARERSARTTVITFDHHPDEILIGAAPPLLCDPDERLELLARAGVDVTIVQTFDAALRMTPYDAFIRRIDDRVDLAGFLMTPDAALGHERLGTPATVAALGVELGYEVVIVPPMDFGGHPVRSGEIRAAIASGDLRRAAGMLGRPYVVRGFVDQAGVSDVDLRLPMPVALPPRGSYPVRVESASDASNVRSDVASIGGDGTVRLRDGAFEATPAEVRVTFES